MANAMQVIQAGESLMNEEKYIPINKGHFELDTLDRTTEFFRKPR